MRKIASFIIGAMMVLPVCAANFIKDDLTGMYNYTGDSVASVSVDFTKWSGSDLYDAAVGANFVSGPHTLAFTEKENMGFQKWVIYPNRWFASGVNKNALFNNAQNNAEADSLDQPAIYFPPVKGGIKQISVTGKQGGRPLIVLGYRESTHEWENLGTLAIPNAYDTYTFNVNSADICRVALYGQQANTAYTSITHINISSLNEEEKPEETSLYVLNPITGFYTYNGEPVDDIDIDFANWDPTDLPSTFTDDMALVEVQDYGFVKWKIQAYKSGVVDQNVLFNNNATDFGGSPTNNNTTNPPAIYFPTTVRGVEKIEITYVIGANPAWLNYTCKDDNGSNTANVQLPASTADDPQTYTLNLNTEGQTTVYFLYKVTAWPRIMSIKFTLAEETPTAIESIQHSAISIQKVIEKGQLVIIKNGVRYNALGVQL